MGRASSSTNDTKQRRLLVADDDAALLKSVMRLLSSTCEIEVVGTCEDAVRAIDSGRVLGVIADLMMPDGDGFRVIEHARIADATLPALLITGFLDPDVASRAFSLGITYLPKPLSPDNLLSFARRCLAHPVRASERVELLADEWESRYHLTPTERGVLVATARGMSREELLSSRGIAETTLKRHVTNLLLKTKEASLDRAALRFLREVLNALE